MNNDCLEVDELILEIADYKNDLADAAAEKRVCLSLSVYQQRIELCANRITVKVRYLSNFSFTNHRRAGQRMPVGAPLDTNPFVSCDIGT
jgi:hypothetical protein